MIEDTFATVQSKWERIGAYRKPDSPILIPGGPQAWPDTEVNRGLDARNTEGFRIEGLPNAILWGTGGGTTLDLTASRSALVRDLTIRADEGGWAAVFARGADGASAGNHIVERTHFVGPTLVEGSECVYFDGCIFESNDGRVPLVIRNGPQKPLGYTMQQVILRNCQYINFFGKPGLRITSTATLTDITLDGGGFSCGGATDTGANDAAMVIDTGSVPDHQCKQIHISNMRWEAVDRKVSILLLGYNGVVGLAVRDSTFHQQEALIRGSRLDYSTFDNVDTSPASPTYTGPAIDSEPGMAVRVNLSNAAARKYGSLLRT